MLKVSPFRDILGCVVLAAAITGCGSATAHEAGALKTSKPSVALTAPVNTSTRVVGDSPEAELLQDVVQGVSAGILGSVTLGGDPSVSPVVGTSNPTGVTWIYFTVSAGVTDRVTWTKQEWLSSLVAGAYKDEAAGQDFPPLEGYSIRGVNPDGSIDPSVGGDYRIGLGASEPITEASPSALESAISARLEQTPFTLVSFSVESPDQNAPVVVVQTDNSDAAGGSIDLSTIFGDPFQYEGFYLQINNSSGEPIRVYGQSSRTQISVGWTDPSVMATP